jgi:hypothetical protein
MSKEKEFKKELRQLLEKYNAGIYAIGDYSSEALLTIETGQEKLLEVFGSVELTANSSELNV